MGPWTFHQQFMFRNFFRIVGVKGEVWGIFPGYVGKIIDSFIVGIMMVLKRYDIMYTYVYSRYVYSR